MYVCRYVHLSANAQGDVGIGSLGTGVPDGYDHPDLGARIQTGSLRGVRTLNSELPRGPPGIPFTE